MSTRGGHFAERNFGRGASIHSIPMVQQSGSQHSACYVSCVYRTSLAAAPPSQWRQRRCIVVLLYQLPLLLRKQESFHYLFRVWVCVRPPQKGWSICCQIAITDFRKYFRYYQRNFPPTIETIPANNTPPLFGKDDLTVISVLWGFKNLGLDWY